MPPSSLPLIFTLWPITGLTLAIDAASMAAHPGRTWRWQWRLLEALALRTDRDMARLWYLTVANDCNAFLAGLVRMARRRTGRR